jgi:hypothetical protein
MFTGHEFLLLFPLGANLKILCITPARTFQELQAEVEAIAEEIIANMMRDKIENVVVWLQRFREVERHIKHVSTCT